MKKSCEKDGSDDSLQIVKHSVACLLVLLACLTGCSKSPAPMSVVADAKSAAARDYRLEEQLIKIAAPAKARVGVSAVVLETGEMVASLNAQDHFPMQSVYKLPISMAVMKQVDAGKVKLE